jgi:hypothetical protein
MDTPSSELPVDELDLELILRSLNRSIALITQTLDSLESCHDRR